MSQRAIIPLGPAAATNDTSVRSWREQRWRQFYSVYRPTFDYWLMRKEQPVGILHSWLVSSLRDVYRAAAARNAVTLLSITE